MYDLIRRPIRAARALRAFLALLALVSMLGVISSIGSRSVEPDSVEMVGPDLLPDRPDRSADASSPAHLAGIEGAIAAREYHASENGSGLQAPNRRHGLRTFFEPTGIRVVDRTAVDAPLLTALRLDALGREGNLEEVAEGQVEASGARVELRRPGLVEWYDNGEAGLEHGFTLETRPEGAGRVVLALHVEGATARDARSGVRLESVSGRSLDYAKLVVYDARGRALDSTLRAARADRIEIAFEDQAAEYPVTVDPILSETADGRLESNQADARLGFSVSSAGDVNGDGFDDVIVGAHNYDAGEVGEGAAFVFLGTSDGVVDAGPLSAQTQIESNQVIAFLGRSVSGAGDVNGDGFADVIVGAIGYDNGQSDEGAAFVFLGSATGIADGDPMTAHAQLESNQASAFLGRSVSGAGDVNGDGFADVIVGADSYDAGQFDEGAAFVYLGGAHLPNGDPSNAETHLESNQDGARLGRSVATGDVNGDGLADVIVGAPDYDAGQANEGAVFVFLGTANGVADAVPASAATQLESDQADAEFGISVSAGDLNGDGFADVIVGAQNYDDGQAEEGAVFVFNGSAGGVPDGDPLSASSELQGTQVGALFGVSAASAGDVNGDGYDDLIVGALSWDGDLANEGAAFVFHGGPTGVGNRPHTRLEGDLAGSIFGLTVASAGDVNGDGFADVIVGSFLHTLAVEVQEGAAFIYHGSPTGIASTGPAGAATRLEGDEVQSLFGNAVASAGDVNGDGFDDVIIGAPGYDGLIAQSGAAFIYHGRSSGIPHAGSQTADTLLTAFHQAGAFGSSVSSAGDANGDGYGDVLVGAHLFDSGQTDEGVALLYLGGPDGVMGGGVEVAEATFQGGANDTWLGRSVAAGDVDGDGFADAIVGGERYDAGQTDEGGAFVFLANGGSGRDVRAKQHPVGGGTGPSLQPWGRGTGAGFLVSLVATDPTGRGRVKLEVEACPAGIPFGELGCDVRISPVWTDVTATSGGVTLSQTFTGLSGGELYHWRARVLRAPFSTTAPGVTPPANPAHGPWRRLLGRASPTDVRVVPEPGLVLALVVGLALFPRFHTRAAARRSFRV